MHLTVFDGYRRAHIRSSTSAPLPALPSGTVADLRDAWRAERFVQRYFSDAVALHRLRAALAADLDAWTGQGDDDVIRMAAARLASGAWSAIVEEVAVAPVVGRIGKAPAGAAPVSARVGRAAPATGRAAPAASSSAPAVVAQEWPESADQVAQAVTLERAAVSATPFCAICAERARARAAAAAAAESAA